MNILFIIEVKIIVLIKWSSGSLPIVEPIMVTSSKQSNLFKPYVFLVIP